MRACCFLDASRGLPGPPAGGWRRPKPACIASWFAFHIVGAQLGLEITLDGGDLFGIWLPGGSCRLERRLKLVELGYRFDVALGTLS